MSTSTPFLEVRSFAVPETEVFEVQPPVLASPFRSVYEAEGFSELSDPETEAYLDFMTELYDQEMDEALYELVDEARGMHEEAYTPESAFESEKLLEQHFAPLVREGETMLEVLAQRFSSSDPATLTEADFESLENYLPSASLSPAQEQFFGSLKKLAKKAVRGVSSLAKRGIQLATKLGLGPILMKLKALIKPLLHRVLKLAIGKLPVNLQPFAQKLAEKYAAVKPAQSTTVEPQSAATTDAASTTASTDVSSTDTTSTTPDTTEIQEEFNYQIANVVFAPGEVEQELEVARVLNESRQASDESLYELDNAREQFIQELQNLKEGEDPTPYVQNFIPALLPVLKVGLRLAGRSRVVDFLAKIVGKLISHLVGPQHTPALSRAIVDTGLRLINLEVTEQEEAQIAANTVAATVEETVRKVAAMPEYVVENQALLEAFTLEAFEQSAASYLPPILPDSVYRQRPDLQEGRALGGTAWIGMPFRSRKWCYLKCPRTFKVRITPQMAEAIETFEGNNLADFFYEQMGLPSGETLEAEVHLYEATHHSSVGDIARHEAETVGETTTMQLHPLTPQVAGLLLGDPSLGREMPGGAVNHRWKIGRGQRLYHLGLRGARPLLTHGKRPRVRRHSGVKNIRIDFSADAVNVYFFLSETRAQHFAVSLRKGDALRWMTTLRRILRRGLAPTLAGLRPRNIQIIGGLPPDQALGGALQRLPGGVRLVLTRALEGWLLTSLLEELKSNPQRFISATEDPAEGITVVFTLGQIPGFGQLRELLKGKQLTPSSLDFGNGKPTVKVSVVSGFKRD
jgi:hypothetical protein